MRYLILFLVVGMLVWNLAYADVPKLINFQGRLTDSSGKFVPDGNYSLTFRIYTDSTGGSAKWSEGQLISVSKGLFNVILGSVTPIPDSIFNYPNTWLGIQVGADPEMAPRERLSSLGYAYRGAKADTSSYSLNSDRLDGYDASDFTSPASDYGRLNVATDLYEGATKLTDKYVNTVGPDSVYSASELAFMGKAMGENTWPITGIMGWAGNNSSGGTYAGNFTAFSYGGGWSTGVRGYGVVGSGGNNSYGVIGAAVNNGTGPAYGGFFLTYSVGGTGMRYGIYAYSSPSLGYAGYFEGKVRITDSLVVLGSKSAAVKIDNGEYRLLYCLESTENWFEDFGKGKLVNGKAVIRIDPLFAQTVNTNGEYHVFLTPGGDCNGLYVTNETPNSFEVREFKNGTSNLIFSYRLVAKRKGYESIRLAKMGGPNPEEMEKEQAQRRAEMEREKAIITIEEQRHEPKKEEPPVREKIEDVKEQ